MGDSVPVDGMEQELDGKVPHGDMGLHDDRVPCGDKEKKLENSVLDDDMELVMNDDMELELAGEMVESMVENMVVTLVKNKV